jgi:hypothetical protein
MYVQKSYNVLVVAATSCNTPHQQYRLTLTLVFACRYDKKYTQKLKAARKLHYATDINMLTILLWKCTEVSALAILILFLKATIAPTTLWILVKGWLRVPLPSTTVMESHSQCRSCVV